MLTTLQSFKNSSQKSNLQNGEASDKLPHIKNYDCGPFINCGVLYTFRIHKNVLIVICIFSNPGQLKISGK